MQFIRYEINRTHLLFHILIFDRHRNVMLIFTIPFGKMELYLSYPTYHNLLSSIKVKQSKMDFLLPPTHSTQEKDARISNLR